MTPIYYVAVSLFLTGVVLSSGPCLVTCGPIMVSFIGSYSNSVRSGLKIYLIFCLTRILSYGLIGLITGFAGEYFLNEIYQTKYVNYLYLFFGVFILIVAIVAFISKLQINEKCRAKKNSFSKSMFLNAAIFGLGIGFWPCPPLLGVLSSILLLSNNIWKGFFYAVSFGMGTIVSPLAILSLFASSLDRFFQKVPKILRLIKIVFSILLLLIGMRIIYVALTSKIKIT